MDIFAAETSGPHYAKPMDPGHTMQPQRDYAKPVMSDYNNDMLPRGLSVGGTSKVFVNAMLHVHRSSSILPVA